jgi:hypothetical protein
MRSTDSTSVVVILASVSLLLGAIEASALTKRFRPTYKGHSRLDWCYTWAKNCGQPVADKYCWIKGYEKAVRFEPAHASPTQLIEDGKVCNGGFYTSFKYIECFTTGAQPVEGRGWPQRID